MRINDNIRINLKFTGFLPMLCLVFVAAKLFGAISWSWWWVTAPLWGPFAVFIVGMGVCLGVVGILSWLFSK